jgi:hypothetical protein
MWGGSGTTARRLRWCHRLSIAAVAALIWACLNVAGGTEPPSYNIASCVSKPDGSHLIVFPPDSKPFSIPLTALLKKVVYSPDGRSLYGEVFSRPGIAKIEFNPVRITTLPGSAAFFVIRGFAVPLSEDTVLISGARSDATGTCGIFELSMPTGGLRAVLPSVDCATGSPWRVLGLSPNGVEAMVLGANRHVSLLDVASGTLTPLGAELWSGSYSPDGNWIAALRLGAPQIPSRTILIDRNDLSQRRDLGGLNDDEVVWSPDSRLILHAVPRPGCASQNPLALEVLDAATGKRVIVKNSVCQAGADRMIGWISSDVKK